MLKIVRSIRELDMDQMSKVYIESIAQKGAQDYPQLCADLQFLYAFQDLYSYLREYFRHPRSAYAIWTLDGCYICALRLEEYRDGYLITALETRPDERNRGYAGELLRCVVEYASNEFCLPLYSHIDTSNFASLAVHKKAGFRLLHHYAAYLDGSVDHKSVTLSFPGK